MGRELGAGSGTGPPLRLARPGVTGAGPLFRLAGALFRLARPAGRLMGEPRWLTSPVEDHSVDPPTVSTTGGARVPTRGPRWPACVPARGPAGTAGVPGAARVPTGLTESYMGTDGQTVESRVGFRTGGQTIGSGGQAAMGLTES